MYWSHVYTYSHSAFVFADQLSCTSVGFFSIIASSNLGKFRHKCAWPNTKAKEAKCANLIYFDGWNLHYLSYLICVRNLIIRIRYLRCVKADFEWMLCCYNRIFDLLFI
eukprot:315059_1